MHWRELEARLVASLGPVEGRIVLEEVSGERYVELFARRDAEVEPAACAAARRLEKRRLTGEPLQRVLGHWSFRGLELHVDERALIPRPETEIVVDHVLRGLAAQRRQRSELLVVDLGTGSGAIALAVASEAPDTRVIATDRSLVALALAAENRARLGPAAGRVHFVCGDWWEPLGGGLDGRVDVVVANPPYLSRTEWELAPAVVREWDPPQALVGGEEGTEGIAAVIAGGARVLSPGGLLVVEIGAGQAAAVRVLACRAGAECVSVEPDLAGRDRVLVATW